MTDRRTASGLRYLAPLALLAGLWTPPILAQQPVSPSDLGSLDIEDLARVRVTSVGRKPEALGQAPAAIFVITRDEIRRSGAASMPEALRLAPGLQVARVGSRDWAITSRGFNERSSNKLLVLIDGRAVYSPVFAGVHWDAQDIPLDDVERIEVILGPGATLWGSNAVNGVINVITRSALDTPGGLIDVDVGTETRVAATARQGVRLGPGAMVRGFARYTNFAPSDLPDGTEATDDWQLGHAGLRLDSGTGGKDRVTFEADGYVGSGAEAFVLPQSTPPFTGLVREDLDIHGGNVLGRWSRALSASSDVTVQAYFDHWVRKEPAFLGRMRVNVLDLDAQHHVRLGRRQDIVWGLGYRRNTDEITGSYTISFVPASRGTDLVTAFLQDDIALTAASWRLTLGSKLEHNEFTGWEVQPNVRLRWLPTTHHTLWGAVSRAVRIPSRVDADLVEVGSVRPGTPPLIVTASGNEGFDSERLIAYELGYRASPSPRVAMDVSLFYNDYDRLRTFDALPPLVTDSALVVPLTLGNNARGRTYGGTAALNWRPLRSLRLDASYTYLSMRIDTLPGVVGATSDTRPDFNPSHQADARAALSLSDQVEMDAAIRYVSRIYDVPEYLQGDLRLAWRPRPELELAIVGKDLFSPRHVEFASPSFSPETHAIPRRGLLQARWRF
jgi:iron complex outermembrane receptor protein